MSNADLMYRRQFLFGSRAVELSGFLHQETNSGTVLSHHRDLPVTQVRRGSRTVMLLGYILDPQNPKSSDEEVLHRLLDNTEELTGLLQGLDEVGGRYGLIYEDPKCRWFIPDAVSSRASHYVREGDSLWLGSECPILEEVMTLTQDEVFLQDFLNPLARMNEPWIPNDLSPYRGVRRVMSNHVLDLVNGEQRRFWPYRRLYKYTVEDAAERMGAILRGTIEAIFHRANLAFPLTCGWDSRTLLAASRPFSQKITYYTQVHSGISPEHPDVKIPQAMSERFGFRHETYQSPSSVSDEAYQRAFDRATALPYANKYHIIYSSLQELEGQWVVSGNAASTIKARYYDLPGALSSGSLARSVRMGAAPLVRRAFAEWTRNARPAAEANGIHALDLFEWEHRCGSWYPSVASLGDLAHEVVSPYACRSLLAAGLGTPRGSRMRPPRKLYRALIENLWPELLEFPVNPPTRVKTRLRRFGEQALYSVLGRRPDRYHQHLLPRPLR